MSDLMLIENSARRVIVDAKPGFPCRVSLCDAEIGEAVLLVNFEHQPHATPYKAAHAVFVREGAEKATPAPGVVPEALSQRLLSIRAFGGAHMMVDADTATGEGIVRAIEDMFDNPAVAYLHLHFAGPGCFAAKVSRLS